MPVPVLHDNIGLEGVSNGGNIIVAVAALFGDEREYRKTLLRGLQAIVFGGFSIGMDLCLGSAS